MGTINQIFAGLSIFKKYGMGKEFICAEHDIIYGLDEDKIKNILNPSELKILEEEGWHIEDRYWVHYC